MGEIRGLPTREVEPYVTKIELADHLHVSTKTITLWMKQGMPHEKWGPRLVRFRKSLVLQWVRERGRNAA